MPHGAGDISLREALDHVLLLATQTAQDYSDERPARYEAFTAIGMVRNWVPEIFDHFEWSFGIVNKLLENQDFIKAMTTLNITGEPNRSVSRKLVQMLEE